jgi:hypothetical protein
MSPKDSMLVSEDAQEWPQVIHELKTARNLAAKSIEDSAAVSKRQFDRNRKVIKYAVGDIVLLTNPAVGKGRCRAFTPKMKGPYRIIRCTQTDFYELEHINNAEDKQEAHVSRMTPYLGLEDPGRSMKQKWKVKGRTEEEKEESRKGKEKESDEEEFEVEDILDVRTKRGVVEYLIKWKGYSQKHCTWEPKEHLRNAPDILARFEARRARKTASERVRWAKRRGRRD